MTRPSLPVPDGSQTLGDIAVSIIRTVVPGIIGTLIAWLVTRGFDLSSYENAVNLYLVPACIAGYYSLVRVIEKNVPAFGVLLGYKRPPVYIDPAAVAVTTQRHEPSYLDRDDRL